MSRIAMVKEAGTHPPIEGLLAPFATVHSIRSVRDLAALRAGDFDLVIVNSGMPTIDGFEVLRRIQQTKNPPLVMVTAPDHSPDRLAAQIEQVAAMRQKRPRRFHLARAARALGLSQEALGRILGVSSRTAHRWLKGSRPRPRAQLEQFSKLFSELERTFDAPESMRSFLHHPNPSLGGETPLHAILRGDFEAVIADLTAVQEGVFV